MTDTDVRLNKETELTQITHEQEQQLRAAAQRVGTKLQDFHNGLPANERAMLDLALQHVTVRTEETGEDVSGHLGALGVAVVAGVVGYLTGKSVDNFISSTDWGAVGDALIGNGGLPPLKPRPGA